MPGKPQVLKEYRGPNSEVYSLVEAKPKTGRASVGTAPGVTGRMGSWYPLVNVYIMWLYDGLMWLYDGLVWLYDGLMMENPQENGGLMWLYDGLMGFLMGFTLW